jgi:hypothetical protein
MGLLPGHAAPSPQRRRLTARGRSRDGPRAERLEGRPEAILLHALRPLLRQDRAQARLLGLHSLARLACSSGHLRGGAAPRGAPARTRMLGAHERLDNDAHRWGCALRRSPAALTSTDTPAPAAVLRFRACTSPLPKHPMQRTHDGALHAV